MGEINVEEEIQEELETVNDRITQEVDEIKSTSAAVHDTFARDLTIMEQQIQQVAHKHTQIEINAKPLLEKMSLMEHRLNLLENMDVIKAETVVAIDRRLNLLENLDVIKVETVVAIDHRLNLLENLDVIKVETVVEMERQIKHNTERHVQISLDVKPLLGRIQGVENTCNKSLGDEMKIRGLADQNGLQKTAALEKSINDRLGGLETERSRNALTTLSRMNKLETENKELKEKLHKLEAFQVAALAKEERFERLMIQMERFQQYETMLQEMQVQQNRPTGGRFG